MAQSLNVLQTKFELQLLVRLALTTVNSTGLLRLYRATQTKWGSLTGTMFLLVTCTQFHLLFWMGRTLPNMFALYPVNVASSLIVTRAATPQIARRNFNLAISLLIFAGVVLRAELILLIGPLVLQGLYLRKTTVFDAVKTGIKAGVVSLALTVLIDSYLWKQLVWPELAGQYFNVYQGKSAEWGVSPFHAYFVAHLPKLLLTGLPLAILGLIVDSEVRSLVVPYVTFMLLLSFHGHKEWRFIIYAVPIWNIAAGRGAAWLYKAPARRIWKNIIALFLLGCFGLNIIATIFFTQVSMANYPGGHALYRFNEAIQSMNFTGNGNITVHIDNLAAQTGATLFLQEYALPSLGRRDLDSARPRVIYNKTEDLSAERDFENFDWVITERPSLFLTEDSMSRWEVWDKIDGLETIKLESLRGVRLLRVPRIIRKSKLWLLTQHAH